MTSDVVLAVSPCRMGKIYNAFTFFLQAFYYCPFHSYVHLVTQNQSNFFIKHLKKSSGCRRVYV